MILFGFVYLLLMASIASPPLLIVSLPVTYLALRFWSRRSRAQRQAQRRLAEAQRFLAEAQRAESLFRTLRGWS